MEGRKKKRQRRDESDDDMEDDNIVIDVAQKLSKKDLDTSGDVDMQDGMIYSDFVFSGLRDTYFHTIRSLIKPLFEFDNVNSSGLADVLLSLKEDVGTVVKNEDEEETQSKDVDVFAVFSLLPLTFFADKGTELQKTTADQVLNVLKEKINKYTTTEEEKQRGMNILRNFKVALLVTERMINLPQEAVPITLNFLVNEIAECKAEENYDSKFELDYVIAMSKFVRKITPNDFKTVKKSKTETNEEILHYKYETEHFIKESDLNISYKIPYELMNLDYLENKNEPQYYCINFIKSENFLKVVNFLNTNK